MRAQEVARSIPWRWLKRSSYEPRRGGVRNSPFGPGDPSLILHCAYHKAGTVWFRKIFDDLAKRYGLRLEQGIRGKSIDPESDIALYPHSWDFNREILNARSFRGTHMVRDPRDLVVSSYIYHLRTDEAWALRPNKKWGGVSYQQYLNSLNSYDGLMTEIERWSKTPHGPFIRIAQWNYKQPEF